MRAARRSSRRGAPSFVRAFALFSLVAAQLVVAQTAAAQSADGTGPWRQYAVAEEAGWSSELLEEAHGFAEQIHSAAVMAVYRGHVLFAWGDVSRRFMCHSVRKSFLSALYGIGVAEGDIDLQATLEELGIGEREPLTDTEKTARVVDLISARSGVYLPAAYAPASMDENMPDRGSHAPGTNWYYNNWDFNTAGEIFNRLTGLDLYEAFERRIAGPIGMEDFRLEDGVYVLEPSRSLFSAYTFRMSTRDMARFGQLFLQDGVWDGERILPEGWVAESTAMHSEFDDGRGYGYMWWVDPAGTMPADAGRDVIDRLDKYEARGSGGQVIMVVPEAELVIVHRGDTDNDRGVGGNGIWRLMDRIVAARTGEAVADPELTSLAPRPLADVLPAPPERHEVPLDPAWIDGLVGRYSIAAGALIASVFEYEGRLFLNLPGQGEGEIYPESESDFFLKVAPVTVEFARNEGGEVTGLTLRFADEVYEGQKLEDVPEPDGYADRFETPHFVILAREGEAASGQLALAGERAEAWFEALADLLGEGRTSETRLLVLLDGSGIETGKVPHVDRAGRIYLYRFTDEFEDYLDSLLHEMVHAFRRATGHRYSGFVEEGLAQAIDAAWWPDKVSFPLYGFSGDLVAGHLLDSGEAIPLDLLRGRGALNRSCQLQAYAERGSFFSHLRDSYGLESVIALAYDAPAGGGDAYGSAFGVSFAELVDGWSGTVLATYRQIPAADARWSEFRTESPARYQRMCIAATDY